MYGTNTIMNSYMFRPNMCHLQRRSDTKVRYSKMYNDIIRISEPGQTWNICEDGEIVGRIMCEFVAYIT